MTSTQVEWVGQKTETSSDRRRHYRSPQKVAIEVCGFNRQGRFFSEKTTTSDVSVGGCRFDLRTDVEKESVLAIRVIKRRNGQEMDSKPLLFQVNWSQPQPDGYAFGVSKLQPGAMWSEESAEVEVKSKMIS